MHALLLCIVLAADIAAGQRAAVDAAVRLVMETQHVAGLSLGISHAGKTYERGYGVTDAARGLPARPSSIYRIGSLTKQFTADTIVALANAHRLRLDDPVRTYLPAFPWGTAVTVRNLLAQTSGIPSYTDTPLDRHATYAPQQLIDAVAKTPLAFAPGTAYDYSNTNYVLLGTIAERVTGEPFSRALQTLAIDPAHLASTQYGDVPDEAIGYRWDGAFAPVAPSSVSFAYAAAAMTSTVSDLLQYLQRGTPPYGLRPAQMYGYTVQYASGNVDGYSAFELIASKNGDEVVILTNADQLDLIPLAKSIFAVLEPPKPGTHADGFGSARPCCS